MAEDGTGNQTLGNVLYISVFLRDDWLSKSPRKWMSQVTEEHINLAFGAWGKILIIHTRTELTLSLSLGLRMITLL